MTSALRRCFDSGPELWPLTLFCVVDARSQVVVEDHTSFYDFGLMLLWIYGLRGLEEKSRSRIKVGLDLGTISFSIRTHEMSVAKPTTSTKFCKTCKIGARTTRSEETCEGYLLSSSTTLKRLVVMQLGNPEVKHDMAWVPHARWQR